MKTTPPAPSSRQTPPSIGQAGPPSVDHIRRLAQELVDLYPPPIRAEQQVDIPRMLTHVGFVIDGVGPAGRVCDLGGGIGLFTPLCAKIGMRATLVDDFDDDVNRKYSIHDLRIHESLGVDVIASDVLASGLDFPPSSFDCVTTFDSMEHWHNSPKNLFEKIVRWLRPGGLFILGVPNCVNLRKRLTVPFGIGKWSGMEEWYNAERFRGHVREPDVQDLQFIARDMDLINAEIYGRNWLGYRSRSLIIKLATRFFDNILQFRPSFCSDIYLLGHTKTQN